MLVPTDNCRKDFAVGYSEDTLPTGAMRQMLKLFSLAEIPRNQSLAGIFGQDPALEQLTGKILISNNLAG